MVHLGITPNTSAYSTSICKAQGYIIYSLLRPWKDTFLVLRTLQGKCPILSIIHVTHPCAGSRALTAQHELCFSLELHELIWTRPNCGDQTCFWPLFLTAPRLDGPVPPAERGNGHGGSPSLCCSGTGTSVCMTSLPARDGNLLHGTTMHGTVTS